MNIHYLQHVPFEGLGCIEEWAHTKGHHLSVTRFYKNEPLPEVGTIQWLIVMGGPMGVGDEDKFSWLTLEKKYIERAIGEGKTVIGICLGAQLIADVLGAKVHPNELKEIGWFPIELTDAGQKSSLFDSLPRQFNVFHWHGDTFELPVGTIHLARSAACRNQAFVYAERVLGLQFHLELAPDNVKNLIQNCSAELVAGKFIQKQSQLLGKQEDFDFTNKVIQKLLDRFEKLGC